MRGGILHNLRAAAQSASAAKLAERLAAHPAVAQVLYPGLPDHPGHAVAARQMANGFGYMLSIRLAESGGRHLSEADLFSPEFLLDRALLRSLRSAAGGGAVLLIDEIDRADDEFEALLLEFLGESSITVPELGTFHAEQPPIVVLTSNRSRELHDALKRRCFYHWIEFPSVARAAEIIRRRVPGGSDALVEAATAFVTRTRALELDKPPGLAEAIDWVSALRLLGLSELDESAISRTLGSIVKTPDDLATVQRALAEGSLP